jgi:PAS domain S-box-containing protein
VFSSLRVRVLLLLCAVILVMAVYVVARGYEQRRVAMERLRADVRSQAEHAMLRQEEVIANVRLVLEAVAAAPEIRDPLAPECSTELAKLLRVRPRFLFFVVIGSSGAIDCSAIAHGRSIRLSDMTSLRRATEMADFAIGEYQLDRVHGGQLLDLALPVRNQKGEISAVVMTAVDLAWLGDSIGGRLLPPGSAVDLIRSDGTLVARYPHTPELIGQSIVGTPLYAAMGSSRFRGNIEAIGFDGVRRSYEVFDLPQDHGGTPGYTVIGIPVSVAIDAIDEQLRFELIALVAMTLIVLGGGYVGGHLLFARPIKKLIDMSKRIEAGDRGIRSGLSANLGEIGMLGGSIDRMMTSIEDYEGQLARRQQQLADSQQLARLFSWRWIPSSGDIEVSDSIFSILGVTPDAWQPSYDALMMSAHPDDRPLIDEAVAGAIGSKDAYLVEYRIVRPDGEVREVWELGRCELNAKGEVAAVCGIVQDITALKGAERERRQAIDTLRKSEEQFRSAIEVSPVGMALLAPDGTWMFVNEALCRIVGFSAHELLSTSLRAITYPGDRHGDADPVQQTSYYRNDTYEEERRLVCKDGRTAWVLLSASLVWADDVAPRYFILQMHDISERKAIEMALRASEERYRRLLEVIPDAVTIHRNGQLEFVNDAAIRLFGATRANEVLGRSLFDFVSPDFQSFMRERIKRLQDVDRDSPLIELQVRRFDGTSTDVEATGCSFSGGDARLTVTILRDITLRKRGEQALRDSEEQLRLIADSLPIVLARVDRNGRYLFLNAEGAQRSGIASSAVIGRTLREVLGDQEYAKIESHFQKALTGTRVSFSTNLSYRDGVTREIEAIYIPDFAPAGGVRGAFMVSIDVTARKLAEAASRENERRFQHLVETANAVPYTWDVAGGRYTYLGPQAARLFAHPPELLLDRVFWLQQIHPDDQERVLRHVARFASNPSDAQIIYRIVGRDGRTIWVNDTVTVETTEGGRKIGYGLIIDVTENILRDRQIEQSQKMEALGQMTGGLAHDLNNLLTVVVVNLELVARRLKDESQKHRISQAIEAASSGTELAGRMLAFARRQVLRPKVVNLSGLVEEFLVMVRRALGETIETRLDLAADVAPVVVDRGALEAALLNLAINARDAMPEGGTLTISVTNTVFDQGSANKRPEIMPGPYVTLTVSDTGLGMAPEVLARAFEPFFTTKDVGKGTGLGLSMVYGFVKQSSGFVYIDSEKGRGTTVRLHFPSAEAEVILPPVDLAKPAGLPDGNETVLVVEDAAAVRTATSSLLESLGYRVLQADDGRSALELADKHLEIDLVLSDVIMPGGMKGPDLARHLLKRRPNLKLLYMSGYADDANFRDGTFEPYAALITKPFRSEELARRVREVLGTRKFPRRKTLRRAKLGT